MDRRPAGSVPVNTLDNSNAIEAGPVLVVVGLITWPALPSMMRSPVAVDAALRRMVALVRSGQWSLANVN
jgi:hypothetical protein